MFLLLLACLGFVLSSACLSEHAVRDSVLHVNDGCACSTSTKHVPARCTVWVQSKVRAPGTCFLMDELRGHTQEEFPVECVMLSTAGQEDQSDFEYIRGPKKDTWAYGKVGRGGVREDAPCVTRTFECDDTMQPVCLLLA